MTTLNALNVLDEAIAGGAKSFFTKDSPIGSTVTGTITSVSVMQATDFATGQPLTWDNGDPRQQAVITLQTSLRDHAEDTGERGIYIKLWGVQKNALAQAVRKAGKEKASEALTIGSTFTATLTGTKPSQKGSPTKLYEYTIQPAAVAQLDTAVPPQATPMPMQDASANPWAPQAPTPAPAPVAPTPAPAAAAPGTPPWAEQARNLQTVGIGPEQIAAALQVPEADVRNVLGLPPF